MSLTITQIPNPSGAKMSTTTNSSSHTNGHHHTSSSTAGVTVKEERHDEAEIAELAAKMLEAHKLQTAKTVAAQQVAAANRQAAATLAAANNNNNTVSSNNTAHHNNTTITANGHQTNIMSYLTRKPAGSAANGPSETAKPKGTAPMSPNGGSAGDADDKKACDEESQKGHFGWATFGKIHIPYILRQSEKYCAVRMVEMKLLNKYLNYLHQDIYSCTCVRSYYITEAESRLLNEINHKHCDSQFGREMFSQKDLVVRLSDANKFYQFLDICYKKLLMGNSGPSDKCGFIRINKESVVPYTVRDTEKFVPLFYFEGETDNLKLKADYLSGWDLSYLKFCCKVQGIRNELFASDSVAVISLIDIKSYFPTGTEFEDYWPSKVVDTQLLVGTKSNNSSVNWTRQPSQPPPKSTTAAATPMPSSVVKANPQTRKANPTYGNPAVAAAAMQQQQQQQQSAVIQSQRSLLHQQQTSLAAAAAAAAAAATGITQGSSISAAVQALANAGWAGGMPVQQNSLGLSQAQTEQVLRMAAQAQFQMSLQQQQQQQQQIQSAQQQLQSAQQQRNNSYSVRGSQQQQQQQFASANLSSRAQQQQQQFQSYPSNVISSMSAAAQAQSQQQTPPPLVRSAAQNQAHMSSAAANSSMRQQLHQQQQQLQQQHQRRHEQTPIAQMTNHHLQQQRGSSVQSVDASGRSLNVIPEVSSNGGNHVPYRVQKVLIDNIMVPCINMKAFVYTELLMTLPDLNEHFFPEISLDTCKRVLNVLRLELYKGNRQQVQTLRENGHHNAENIPLVQVRDVMTFMPQLTYMVRAQQHQEQPPNKRSRMS